MRRWQAQVLLILACHSPAGRAGLIFASRLQRLPGDVPLPCAWEGCAAPR